MHELRGKVEAILELIENVRDEEQEYLDNMPESLAGGDKGSAAQEAVEALEAAVTNLKNIETQAEEADQALETASE